MHLDIFETHNNIRYNYHQEFDDNLLRDWTLLDSKLNNSFISLNPNWLKYWWKNYRDNKSTLHIFSAYKNDTLAFVVPLMIVDKKLMFLSYNCSDYLGVLYESTNKVSLSNLLVHIFSFLKYDEVCLKNIREDMPFNAHLYQLLEGKFDEITVSKDTESLYIKLTDWKKYYSKLSLNLRRNIDKSLNKLEKNQIKYKFEVIFEYSAALLNNLFQIHITNWMKNNDSSTFNDERRRCFTNEISKYFAKNKEFVVFVLRIDEQIVAYRLGFIINNTYQDWNTSFSIKYDYVSIGNILLFETIRYLSDNRFSELNFMNGKEYYKERWTKTSRISYSYSFKKLQKPSFYLRRKHQQHLDKAKGFVFDLDGVVYKDSNPIQDSIDAINLLQDKGYKIGYLTNTSSKSSYEINEKLTKIGIKSNDNVIVTSSIAVLDYLLKKRIKSCYLFGGGDVLKSMLLENNIEIVNGDECKPDCVLFAYSKEFNYQILRKVCQYIENGAKFICTDKDFSFSYNHVNLPGTGWYVNAVEKVTKTEATVIGKPNKLSLSMILKQLNITPSQAVMVGDNLDSDNLAAHNMKMTSCLLLGGVSTLEDTASLPNEKKPHFVFHSLSELINLINK